MADENAIDSAMDKPEPAKAEVVNEDVNDKPTPDVSDTVPENQPPQWKDERASNAQRVAPDAVAMPDGSTTTDEVWQALNPCPLCQSTPHEAPEGTNLDGSPRWTFPHCWKCGYRPSEARNFQSLGGNVPALAGSDTATIDRLIAALQVARDSAPR